MAHLLIEEYPLVIIPSLAKKIGLNQAIFLQQVHYWLEQKRNIQDGKSWVYNSFEEWQKQFPFWSVRTLKRIVAELETEGLILSTTTYNRQNLNRKKWYTIDYDKFNALMETEIKNSVISSSAKKNNTKSSVDNFAKEKEEVEIKSMSKIGENIERNLSTKSQTASSCANFTADCHDPLCQDSLSDSYNLTLPIVTDCHSTACQNGSFDSDKIANVSIITENTTEIITDNTTKTSSSENPPPTPKNETGEKENEGDVDRVDNKKSDIVCNRLYELFEKLHHKPSETEKRRLYLIFEAQGEKATEYAILCSEGKKVPMGYIIAVLKDKSIFSVMTRGENKNESVQSKTGESRFSNNYTRPKKQSYGTNTLPKSEAESKFNFTVPW